jgi:sulfur-oxidizing protein SoxY
LLTASAAVQAAPLLGLLPSPALALPVPPVPPRFFSIEEKVDVTLARIFEGKAIKDSDAITLTAPPIAENGRVVPIEVKFESLMTASGTAFPKNLFIIVDNNRNPLSTSFRFTSATSGGYAACNLRMGETSPVRAIIEMSDGELFGATQRVNVVVGGCGG